MSGQTESLLETIQWQQQLEAKDQLISALTERLEVAAEQLDRIHRSGGDRGGRVGGGGGPSPEALAQQQALLEQLSKSVEIWDDVQPREAFERLEVRLDELKDLLQGATLTPVAAVPHPAKSNSLSGWEKMKAELMGEAGQTAPAHSDTALTATSSRPPATPKTPSPQPVAPHPPSATPEPIQPLGDIELPTPIDFDEAEREELEEAIEVRDQFIGHLARRLRSAESRTHEHIDWASLNNAPAELRDSLQQLESELNDRLRIAEVDLSLERARLSRVETRIRGMQKQIEQRLLAAGHRPSALDGTEASVPDEVAKPKKDALSKSWFGSLGRS